MGHGAVWAALVIEPPPNTSFLVFGVRAEAGLRVTEERASWRIGSRPRRVLLSHLGSTVVISRSLPQFAITRVPAALDPRPRAVQPAPTPRLCAKATACPAVERASTLTSASAEVSLVSFLFLGDFPVIET